MVTAIPLAIKQGGSYLTKSTKYAIMVVRWLRSNRVTKFTFGYQCLKVNSNK
jgi:hypothetical protein